MPTGNPVAAILKSQSYRLVRRHLQREFVARKPTIREAHAIDCAALYAERARLAALDPNATADMQCKLAAAAKHARDFLAAVAAERRKPDDIPIGRLIERANGALAT